MGQSKLKANLLANGPAPCPAGFCRIHTYVCQGVYQRTAEGFQGPGNPQTPNGLKDLPLRTGQLLIQCTKSSAKATVKYALTCNHSPWWHLIRRRARGILISGFRQVGHGNTGTRDFGPAYIHTTWNEGLSTND